MIDLEIRLLNGVEVYVDGERRDLTSRRQRALVAALALSAPRAVSVDQLIDAVWSDEPPAGARATLHTYVSRVRRLLGDEAIVHGPGGYQLASGSRTDVDAVRRIAREARAAVEASPDRAAELAATALEQWRGRSLAELGADPWFDATAHGLDELRSNLVDDAARALVACGRAGDAIELLEPEARSAPLREPTWTVLIEALAAAGRAAEALRVADGYRRHLRDETGLSPGGAFQLAERAALTAADVVVPPVGEGSDPSIASRGEQSPEVASPTTAGLPRAGRLIGRERELAELTRLLSGADGVRLVTVTGPGGVGKTRLVAQLLHDMETASEVFVAELAPLDRPRDVVTSLAAMLDLRSDRVTAAAIAERLQRSSALLVLDNAEHLLEPVRELARVVIDRCPGVGVLVTSRTRLDLPDEHLLPLEALGIDGEGAPAVELFVDRLRQTGRGHAVDPPIAEVRAICRRLDGLPLALELAAGRAAVLGVDGFRDRLDDAIDLAGAASADRHASLRAVVAWSYELLDPLAQRLVDVLSVFDGEFDLEAAEQIGAAVLGQPVSLVVGRLVDTSLVAATGVVGRYRLLEVIRQFGRERLAVGGDEVIARRAHARWVSDRLSSIVAGSVGDDEGATSSRLDALRPEVRGALRYTADSAETDLAARLLEPLAGPLLYRPDAELVALGRSVVAGVVDRAAGAEVPADVAAAGARLAVLAGDLDAVEPLVDRTLGHRSATAGAVHRALHARGVLALYQGRHEDSLDAFTRVVDDSSAAISSRLDALGGQCLALCYSGRTAEASSAVEQHAAIADVVDSETYRAFALYVRGELALAAGEPERAAQLLSEASDRAWNVGASFVWGIASTVYASVLVRHRPAAEAARHLPVLVERWRRTATWPQLWTTLRLVAELVADAGDLEVAALVVIAASGDPSAPPLAGPDRERDVELRDRLRERLGPAAFDGLASVAADLDRLVVIDRAVGALERLAR